jgi:hypothetical protein
MNSFKTSEKPSHKCYSNRPLNKEFITDREFVLDHSMKSSDLNLSFNSIEGSFFSESSKQPVDDLLNSPTLPKPMIRRSKEEETNYTTKASPVVLEKEEFKKTWFCSNCEVLNCETFCLIF